MKLTIEQLSKLTKLSIPTLRVYVSRQKLGMKVGSKRLFSQSDVQALLKASKKSPVAKAGKSTPKKKVAAKKTKEPTKAAAARPKAEKTRTSEPAAKRVKPSFWTRLFGGRQQKTKVSLMDTKTTR
jgi:DNA-binding transcriptional MerR regulator